VNRHDSVFETEPSVVGAWPASPVSPVSPPESHVMLWEWEPIMFPEISEFPDEIRQMLDTEDQEKDLEADLEAPISEQEEVDELKRSQSPSFFEDNDGQSGHGSEGKPASIKEDDVVVVIDKHVELKEEVSKIKGMVDKVFNDVQILRYSKRKAASHIHKAERKIENLDKRLTNVDSLCSSHSEWISDTMEAESSKLTSIVAQRDDEEKKKDATLNALLEEMRVFREQTSKQITEEVEALKAAREDALETIKDLTAQVQAQTSSSLKRKRSDNATDEEQNEQDLPPRKIKRRRRIVSKVLRTAGVFTVGAVATWSALAFS